MTRRRVEEQLAKRIETAVRKLQLHAFQTLTSSSPVLTGFFRAGWSPSAGAPEPGLSTPPNDATAATAQAAALFSRHTQASQLLASGYQLKQGAVFIVNAVHYGEYLNEGSSAQAPAMFVEQAVATAVAQTRRDIAS